MMRRPLRDNNMVRAHLPARESRPYDLRQFAAVERLRQTVECAEPSGPAGPTGASRCCPAATDLCAGVTCLASSPRNRDSHPVSKRAMAHLRADPAMAGLIDHIGPPKLWPRRLPPFQSLSRREA